MTLKTCDPWDLWSVWHEHYITRHDKPQQILHHFNRHKRTNLVNKGRKYTETPPQVTWGEPTQETRRARWKYHYIRPNSRLLSTLLKVGTSYLSNFQLEHFFVWGHAAFNPLCPLCKCDKTQQEETAVRQWRKTPNCQWSAQIQEIERKGTFWPQIKKKGHFDCQNIVCAVPLQDFRPDDWWPHKL